MLIAATRSRKRIAIAVPESVRPVFRCLCFKTLTRTTGPNSVVSEQDSTRLPGRAKAAA